MHAYTSAQLHTHTCTPKHTPKHTVLAKTVTAALAIASINQVIQKE